MRRRLFSLASLLLLLLCLATVVLWTASLGRSIELEVEWVDGEPNSFGELPAHHGNGLGIADGVLYLVVRRSVGPNALDDQTGRLYPVTREPMKFSVRVESRAERAPGPFSRHAWQWEPMRKLYAGGGTYSYFCFASIPVWVVLAAASALPILRGLVRRRAASKGCHNCHYDLTGNTSGICPECGTAVPTTPRSERDTPPPEYSEALRIVEEWLSRMNESDPCGPRVVWRTGETAYGWTFVVQDEQFVKTLDWMHKRMGGSQRVLITKVDKKLHMLPAKPKKLSDSLKAWEAGEGAAYLGSSTTPENRLQKIPPVPQGKNSKV